MRAQPVRFTTQICGNNWRRKASRQLFPPVMPVPWVATRRDYATHNLSTNAMSSTPYNISAGGTDFSDYYQTQGLQRLVEQHQRHGIQLGPVLCSGSVVGRHVFRSAIRVLLAALATRLLEPPTRHWQFATATMPDLATTILSPRSAGVEASASTTPSRPGRAGCMG